LTYASRTRRSPKLQAKFANFVICVTISISGIVNLLCYYVCNKQLENSVCHKDLILPLLILHQGTTNYIVINL